LDDGPTRGHEVHTTSALIADEVTHEYR
jgi:hypothetical protein